MAVTRNLAAVFSMALGLAIVAPQMVLSQGQPSGAGGPQQDALAIYRAAGADEAQLAKIREAASQFQTSAQARAKQMMALMSDMRNLSLQTDPDQASVLGKQEEMNKLQNEQSTERIKLMLTIRTLLNPAQKQKLVQLMQQRPGGQLGQGGIGGPGGQ